MIDLYYKRPPLYCNYTLITNIHYDRPPICLTSNPIDLQETLHNEIPPSYMGKTLLAAGSLISQ